MNEIAWEKLKPYSGDTRKSFEELCYQIVFEEYKQDFEKGAILTSIDDSGGGDGVEFYLTYPNGDIFGWQAKFFGRLEEGGRKEQIKQSLQTACKKHPNIKKWFLCSQLSLTTEEKEWFENQLPKSKKNGTPVLPENHNVELIHWGDSEFLNYLRRHPSIHKFFFSDKLLTSDWFRERYNLDIQKNQIKAKYNSDIHIPTDVDTSVNKLLGGERLAEILEKEMKKQQVEMYAQDYKESVLKLFSDDVKDEYKDLQKYFRDLLTDKIDIVDGGVKRLLEIKELILLKEERLLKTKISDFKQYTEDLRAFYLKYREISDSELCQPIKHLRDQFDEDEPLFENPKKSFLQKILSNVKKYFSKTEEADLPISHKADRQPDEIKKENNKRSEARGVLFAPLYALGEYAVSSLEWCEKVFELLDCNELHISGDAGMGKTHISFHIYEDQIEKQKRPAIFVFAKEILEKKSLENQLKDLLAIPAEWLFEDFLAALEVCGRVNKLKVPIIIDGLNESPHWSVVWRNGLENLINKIKGKYPHVVLITTYRTSYEDQLFPEGYLSYKGNKDWWKIKNEVRGFEGLTWDAISIYFDYYKIKLDNHSNAIGYFKHPLHLKIFCETKNPERDKEVAVTFQKEDLFEVFDEYINRSNQNITTALQNLDSKYNSSYTGGKLLQIAAYLWENNSRGIPISKNFLTTEELRIFEGENLLIFRDWNRSGNKEEIQFTYDLLGGYFISKHLINTHKLRETSLLSRIFLRIDSKLNTNNSLIRFVKSKEFRTKLLNKESEHPLFDDILRTLSILLIKEGKIFLFAILKNQRAIKYSTESLFEINKAYIEENEITVKDFLKKTFIEEKNKDYLFDLAQYVELDKSHPLNFNFWSELLSLLSVSERDLTWSEYTRKNNLDWKNKESLKFVEQLETACKETGKLSSRVHLAIKKVMWMLTNPDRVLRDTSTRALYYYGRKYPEEFFNLLSFSLTINDPYVWERVLAALYGIAMANQYNSERNQFISRHLPKYAQFIFDAIFSSDAKYRTTHILARDYAKRTIDIALIHHPGLLNAAQRELISYPLRNYVHSGFGSSEEKDTDKYRDGNMPIHMDFRNYTIGRLVRDRSNYDDSHKEYRQVLSSIYWRIYNLGYSLDKFSEIDKEIGRANWEFGRSTSGGKVDRYGKKYSWIAFYEVAGRRSDLEVLKGWDNIDQFRISDVDIDPSFPLPLRDYDFLNELGEDQFFIDFTKEPQEWCKSTTGFFPNEYLSSSGLMGLDMKEKVEWTLLKAHLSDRDSSDHRGDIYISSNAVLMDEANLLKVKSVIDNYSDYTFENIETVKEYYLYEGEVPWCDLMPDDYSRKVRINYNFRTVDKIKKEFHIQKDGKPLSKEQKKILQEKEIELLEKKEGKEVQVISFGDEYLFMNQDQQITEDATKMLGFDVFSTETPYQEEESDFVEIEVETAVYENSWEGYHSEIVPSGETQTPSKAICNFKTGLFLKPQTSDVYQGEKIISTSFKHGSEYLDSKIFTYIKKDFLEEYLVHNKKKLVYFEWGQKRYFPDGIKGSNYFEGKNTSEFKEFYRISAP